MTELAIPVLTDDELVALARELSSCGSHDRLYMGEPPRPIAGSPQDQILPVGVENPLWQIVRQLPARPYWGPGGRLEPDGHWASTPDGADLRRAYAAGLDRHNLCARYTWSIPSPGDITWLAERLDGRGIVEIGAGSGYWAWQLAQAGIAVAAYDPHPPGPENKYVQHRLYHPVMPGDHTAAMRHPDRVLMLCWPCYGDPYANEALRAYGGDTVIYIGEGPGGCCADDEFHSALTEDFDEVDASPFHVTYWGIHCELTLYSRRVKQIAPGEHAR